MRPFAFPAVAVLPAVNEPLAATPRELVGPVPAVSQSVRDTRTVAVDNHVGVLEELIELSLPLECLEVDIDVPLAELAVRDEGDRVRLSVCGHTQDVCAHQGQHARHRWAGNHFGQVEHFNACQGAALRAVAGGPGCGRQLLVGLVDLVERLLDVQAAVRRGCVLIDGAAGPARHVPPLVGLNLEG